MERSCDQSKKYLMTNPGGLLFSVCILNYLFLSQYAKLHWSPFFEADHCFELATPNSEEELAHMSHGQPVVSCTT